MPVQAPAPTLRTQTPVTETSATWLLIGLAGVCFVAHMLVAGNYGYFRDELYYIADGHHLQPGYVDQPALLGWLAALLRITVGDSLVAIHVIPALACALIIVVTGLVARELGGGRTAQLVAGIAALFCTDFMATGSIFSMDVLDQLWWALASLVLARLLRRDSPRLWLLFGLVAAMGFLTKLTILFFGLAVTLALVVTRERRHLRTRWPWLALGVACAGLLPYVIWNAANGWPTWDFYRHYRYLSTGPLAFFISQIGLMNPIAFPLAAAGLVFYFRKTGVRYRLLGWTFAFVYLVFTVTRGKPYFLGPAYPILFAAGAVALEQVARRPRLAWIRPAYVTMLVLVGVLLAPVAMPILPPATFARVYGARAFPQSLSDRFGWDSLTETVEKVYAGLPSEQRAHACVLASNYGEAGALSLLAAPGRLPQIISGHNNYYLWGPGTCTGKVLIVVGYSQRDLQAARAYYASVTLAAVQTCQYCRPDENNLSVFVLSDPKDSSFDLAKVWHSLKHYD